MKLLLLFSVVVLQVVAASPAWCGGAFAPVTLDSATTLPKGVRSFRVSGFSTQILDKYDGYGAVVPLANSFNKGVTWRQLIDSRPSAFERGQLKGGLQAEGIDPSETAGDSHGLVNASLSTTIPVLAYGLTDKITIGIGLPIVHTSTNVSAGWTISALGQDRIDMLMRRGFEGKIMNVKADLQNVVTTRIANYGYQPLTNEEHTDIGDLSVGMKWQFYSNDNFQVALAPKVVLPTGRTADVNKVVDVAPGSGQIDTGLSLISDYTLSAKWLVTSSAGYLYQIESTKAKRIPRTGDELISPDIDWSVREKLGDLWGAGSALKYRFNDLMIASIGYSFQYKDQDSYIGGEYAPDHYHYLEADTFQTLHAAQVAFSATTVPLYKAGAVSLPLDATISYARVLAGRNVSHLDVWVFEVAAYF